MPRRNLTQNDSGGSVDNYEGNPFSSDSGDEFSFDQNANTNLMHNQYRATPFTDSYSPTLGNTSETPPDRSRNESAESPSGIVAPTSYNRYPIVGRSRDTSSSTLSSHFGTSEYQQVPQSGSSSSIQNVVDPFISNVDFSPFGGYPASSFPLHIDEKEVDDYLHNPDPVADAEYDKNRFFHDLKNMDRRSLSGLIGFIIFFLGAATIFVIIPVLTYSGATSNYKPESFEVMSKYTYPLASSIRTSLIDPDTPQSEYTRENRLGEKWVLTFSDEFNAEGRTFYDGDDQFFQAVDLNYAATKDLEWYDPDAVTTENGSLVLRMDAIKNHDLFYRSGMVQSWNKLCFTQGMIVMSAMMPGYGNVSGLWPGLWTMGNLGRPGYLATTEGVWPYAYDSCDAGITANQSSSDGISYLPGQKLNVCTCPGEDHPNRGTGRGAPEIDIVEGAVDSTVKVGVVSQSYQIAPMDIWYMPDYNFIEIYNSEITTMNTYTGGPFQQAVSAVTTLNVTWYEKSESGGNFQEYGYEYLNDDDDGYITWYVGKTADFTTYAYAMGPNGNVGFRRVSKEPMSIIMNMGVSNNWAYIDWPSLNFPVQMRVDYVRIYQPEEDINMTCDPVDFPTSDYIDSHAAAYQNVNYTSWEAAGYTFPKNRIAHGC